MPKLTEEKQKEYVDNDGMTCPYCEHNDIEGNGGLSIEYNKVFQDVKCLECGKYWTDIYTLTGIHVDEKGE